MTALTLPSASMHSNGERMWFGSPARTVAGDGGHPISSAGHTSGRLTGRSRCIGVARPFPRSPTSRSLPFRPGDRQSQLPTPWRANRRTTRKRIRISRRFRRSLDYAPASGRPMGLGLAGGSPKASETDLAQLFVQVGPRMLWDRRRGDGTIVAVANRWSAPMPQPNDPGFRQGRP